MPAYNAEKFIKEAISSIVVQDFSDWELLICDDASTDQTYQCAKEFEGDPRIRVFRNESNLHKAQTVNNLFLKTKGNIITVHDADDISRQNRFSTILKLFQQNPEIAIAGHYLQRMTYHGKPLPLFRKKELEHDLIINELKRSNASGDASLFFSRKVVDKLGQIFRPYFRNNMDYDFILRATEQFKIKNSPETLYYYRNVPLSISKNVPDFRKLIMPKISLFFKEERQKNGVDSLQKKDFKKIKIKESEFAKPYLVDKTLHLREMAAFFMYTEMPRNAINYMIKAVKREPFKFKNWTTLQYCLRKTIFKF